MPASSTAATSRFAKSTSVMRALSLRHGGYGFASRRILRINDVHLATGLGLHDDEGSIDLPVGTELQNLAGKQGVLEFELAKLITDGVFVERAGFLNRDCQDTHGIVGRRGIIRIRIMPGELLVILV